jgi:2-polyprenyl-3-methyl-5-hydroxy-6-metoxy-1,4-benzoquinol methylase
MSGVNQVDSIRAFWNSRAGLGKWAGTPDLIAKELELKTLAEFVRPGMKILDAGCGNGVAAIELARRFQVEITAMDYATDMVAAASQTAATVPLIGTIQFREGDVTNLRDLPRDFDLIYTVCSVWVECTRCSRIARMDSTRSTRSGSRLVCSQW